jgi:hypothetical protein
MESLEQGTKFTVLTVARIRNTGIDMMFISTQWLKILGTKALT